VIPASPLTPELWVGLMAGMSSGGVLTEAAHRAMLLAAGWLLGGIAVGSLWLTINLRNPAFESAVGPPIRALNEEVASWFGCLPPPYLSLDELCDDSDEVSATEMNEMDLRRLELSDDGGLLLHQRRFPEALPQAGAESSPRADW
jgi:hypothetical protein